MNKMRQERRSSHVVHLNEFLCGFPGYFHTFSACEVSDRTAPVYADCSDLGQLKPFGFTISFVIHLLTFKYQNFKVPALFPHPPPK